MLLNIVAMKLSYNIILLLSVYVGSISAQSILDQYIAEALSSNLELTLQQQKINEQQNLLDQSQRLWGVSADFNFSYLLADGGRKINFPIGDIINPVYATLNQVTGQSRFPTDVANINTQLTPNNFVDAQLSLAKPIINQTIKNNVNIHRKLLALPMMDKALIENEIRLQMRMSYYNFIKTIKGREILDQSIALLTEVLSLNRTLVKHHKVTEEAIYDVEYQIENLISEVALLSEQEQLAQSYVNLLRNKPLDTPLDVDTVFFNKDINNLFSTEELMGKAISGRAEFKKIELSQELNALQIRLIDQQKLPTLGVVGGIGLQTEDFSFNAGGPLFTLAAGLKWNLHDGGLRKRKIAQMQIQHEANIVQKKRLEQQVSFEINSLLNKIEALNARVRADQQAIVSAQKSYDITESKYRNGRVLLIELLQAHSRLQRVQLSAAMSRIDMYIAFAKLQNITAE